MLALNPDGTVVQLITILTPPRSQTVNALWQVPEEWLLLDFSCITASGIRVPQVPGSTSTT